VGIREKHAFNFRKVTVMTKLSSLKTKMAAFTTDESGATLIEYGVIVALILAVSVALIKTIGGKVKDGLTNVSGQL
jgi:pilus assembly protein Flp/PilA